MLTSISEYSPKELRDALKEHLGLESRPLGHGSLKGVSLEEGGGFKVNFADGGLLMYHPETRSHHGGAYYKISTGKGGTHRYDLSGKEIDPKK